MKRLVVLTAILAAAAAAVAVLALSGRWLPLGRLPGDLRVEGRYGVIVIPVTTCLLISVVLTALINLLLRCFRDGP